MPSNAISFSKISGEQQSRSASKRVDIGSPDFYDVVDLSGLAVTNLVLQPRQPKQLEIRFGRVSSAAPGAYQGYIRIQGVTESLATDPYVYVSLRIGTEANPYGAPLFRNKGQPVDSVSFPGYSTSNPDSARPSLHVEIFNLGSNPIEVAAEIEPEGWLRPKSGWNAAAIPAQSGVDVELFVDRDRANRRSALPRYTYFTVRTAGGFTARLLVQDNDANPVVSAPLPLPSTATHSYILTKVLVFPGAYSLRTKLRLGNVSDVPVQADLYYIPSSTSGLQAATRTSVVVPPNDVVAISDLLGQLFGITFNTVGQVEIRTAAENAQFLTVNAASYFGLRLGGGETAYHIPIVLRGEGAREGKPHVISGINLGPTFFHHLTLLETTRLPDAVLKITFTLLDANGSQIKQAQRGGAQGIETDLQLFELFGLSESFELLNGKMRIDVKGPGAMMVMYSLEDRATLAVQDVLVSQPIAPVTSGKAITALVATPKSYAVLGALNGPLFGRTYTTTIGLTAVQSPADLVLSYRSANSSQDVGVRFSIAAGQSIEIPDVVTNLFRIPADLVSRGMITIDASAPLNIHGRVTTAAGGGGANLPIISTLSDAITSAAAGFQRPVYFDGLEQSLDPTRGSRWSLSLSEVNGAPAVVTVRLYEAGNRTEPIAEQDFDIAAHEHKVLDTVFAAMGLDTTARRKERTNVQVVVVPKSGYGVIAAVADGLDVMSGAILRYVLTPNGGVTASGESKVAAVPLPVAPPRHRATR